MKALKRPQLQFPWLIALLWMALPPHIQATELPQLEASAIMQRVADRDLGANMASIMTMTTTLSSGKVKDQKMRSFGKQKDTDRWSTMFFTEPKAILNTGFLSLDYKKDQTDDQQWLYLPAIKRTKKIGAKDKDGRFMGTDFSFYDLTLINTDKFTYTLTGTSTQGDTPVWQIRATPNSKDVIAETGYTQSDYLVRAEPFIILQATHQTSRSNTEKRYRVDAYREISGIWVITSSEMATYRSRKLRQKTVMSINGIRFDQKLPDTLFSVRALERGL
jgi:hypothetical protein